MYRITFTATVEPYSTLTQSISCDRADLDYFLTQFMGYVVQELNLPENFSVNTDGVVTEILDGDHAPGTTLPVNATEWEISSGEWHWIGADLTVGTLTWDVAR